MGCSGEYLRLLLDQNRLFFENIPFMFQILDWNYSNWWERDPILQIKSYPSGALFSDLYLI